MSVMCVCYFSVLQANKLKTSCFTDKVVISSQQKIMYHREFAV